MSDYLLKVLRDGKCKAKRFDCKNEEGHAGDLHQHVITGHVWEEKLETAMTKPTQSSTGGDASDPLKPSVALLVKLGSAIVHVEEMIAPDGHPFDREALITILQDAEVNVWLVQMDKLAFLPKKRTT